jgi:hypothetical protein
MILTLMEMMGCRRRGFDVMRKFFPVNAPKLLTAAVLWCVSATSSSAWIADYRGTLGEAPIGLMLDYEEPLGSFDPAEFTFSRAHYFYIKYQKNIPLRISEHVDRKLILDELNSAGEPVAQLQLEWPETDPKGKIGARNGAPPDKILGAVVVGSWRSLQTGQTLPIYVVQSDITNGTDGGRCGLNAAQYQHVEKRAADFHAAFVRGDTNYLKKTFGWTLPKMRGVREEIMRAIPHDLFCKDTGFMLGRGAVWFDDNGNIVR